MQAPSGPSARVSRIVGHLTPSPTMGLHSHMPKTGSRTKKTDVEVVASIEATLSAVRRGEFVVVVDDEDRENEGDLIIAAEKATAEKIAFMVNETSGLICVGMQEDRINELKLPQMVAHNTESHGTAFTHSIDYLVGTTTGISASDRAATLRAICDRKNGPTQFARPGHMFPLRSRPRGVLERGGHTEASVDLARLAGLFPAGAMCEIVNKDGTMMRFDDLKAFARKFGLQFATIADLVAYRKITGK